MSVVEKVTKFSGIIVNVTADIEEQVRSIKEITESINGIVDIVQE